jgi:hypothetical protein
MLSKQISEGLISKLLEGYPLVQGKELQGMQACWVEGFFLLCDLHMSVVLPAMRAKATIALAEQNLRTSGCGNTLMQSSANLCVMIERAKHAVVLGLAFLGLLYTLNDIISVGLPLVLASAVLW